MSARTLTVTPGPFVATTTTEGTPIVVAPDPALPGGCLVVAQVVTTTGRAEENRARGIDAARRQADGRFLAAVHEMFAVVAAVIENPTNTMKLLRLATAAMDKIEGRP
jgi:hypothetical protein